MTALTLFDADDTDQCGTGYGPGVRRTDPTTSHMAVQSVQAQLPRQRALVLAYVEANSRDGATAAEVATGLGRQQSVMSKRLSELHHAGLVTTVGTRVGPSGRQLTIYNTTNAGLEALRTLNEGNQQ